MIGEAPAARGGGAAEAVWRRTLRRLGVDLRPGEGSPAALLFASLFLLLTFQIATKTSANAIIYDDEVTLAETAHHSTLYFVGWSWEEISKITGTPDRTLRRKWSYAKAWLKEYMERTQ